MAALRVWRRRVRLLGLLLTGLLPNAIKKPLYRAVFRYTIGPGVRIGLVILDAQRLELGAGTRISHFTVVIRVGEFKTGRNVRVGMLNLIRGGESVELGDFVTLMRLNVLNAIPDHDCTTDPSSRLLVGEGAVIVAEHRIDFTDTVRIGRCAIIGGRNSSLWTHTRQTTAPISIGDFCYLGSEIRVAPGAFLPPECILALGSVLAGRIDTPRSLVGGVPAKIVRALSEDDLALIHKKTRPDLP
jgi:acetyltransferase-like isoleucine patch superfamily enzyme